MSRWIKCFTGLALVVLVVSACVAPDEPDVTSPLSSPLTGGKQAAPTTGSDVSRERAEATPVGRDEEQAAASAREALAEQLSVAAEGIELVSIERVEFGDTSLGCPQPGMMYAQVVVPGYKVLLERDGKTYDVRVGGDRAMVCEKTAREKLSSDDEDADQLPRGQAQAAETAKKALTEEIKVSEDLIEVVSVESVDFPDSSLGCPQPGMAYLQVITPGYKVILKADGKTFDYRVSGPQALLCSHE